MSQSSSPARKVRMKHGKSSFGAAAAAMSAAEAQGELLG